MLSHSIIYCCFMSDHFIIIFFTVLFFATVLTESFTYHLLTKKKCWDGDKEKVYPEMPWFFSVALEDGASVPGRT